MGLLCFMLHISLQMNGTAYREGSSSVPNTVSQKDEKPHTVARARSYPNTAHQK